MAKMCHCAVPALICRQFVRPRCAQFNPLRLLPSLHRSCHQSAPAHARNSKFSTQVQGSTSGEEFAGKEQRMKRFLTTVIFATISTVTCAEWTRIAETTQGVSYVDFSTVRKSAMSVKVWTLFSYAEPQDLVGKTYFSRKTQKVFDCSEETSQITAMVITSGKMSLGDVLGANYDPSNKRPVAPDSIEWNILKAVCSK